MHSVAVYDLIVDVLQGRPTRPERQRVAFEARHSTWERVLEFEGCGAPIDRALCRAGLRSHAPPALRRLLRDVTGTSLHRAALAHQGLREVAALAATHSIRVLALKGAARLLGGEMAGSRSMADIDLLVPPSDAVRCHRLLQTELGYRNSGQLYPHHLPALTRGNSLGIEIHTRLSSTALALDDDILLDTRVVSLEGQPIEIPSPTNMVLHTLEHATGLNWMVHYRLRDILDVASLFTHEVAADAVLSYTQSSSRRVAFETLLSAAHALQPLAPEPRRNAWRTVRRVARTRLALAILPRNRVTANRMFRYASVIAEGSPRTMMRAGAGLLRRMGAAVLPAAATIIAGCSDTTRPGTLEVPPFVFVSDSGGAPGLYLFDHGNIERLSGIDHEDDQPHSAAGRVVFSSRRDGNSEIYIGDLDLADQQRLTNDPSSDGEPALDPGGTTIAFVSSRSGTPRIWLMDVSGANLRPLDTGSQTFTPEGSPAWSPSGDRIAFTSTRTNTSQVFVLDTTMGQAVQWSHEAGGAFAPTWSAEGRGVLYVALLGQPRVMRITSSGGESTLVASGDRVISDPACAANVCLAVAGANGDDGDIIAVSAGRATEAVLVRAMNDRHPAFLISPK